MQYNEYNDSPCNRRHVCPPFVGLCPQVWRQIQKAVNNLSALVVYFAAFALLALAAEYQEWQRINKRP